MEINIGMDGDAVILDISGDLVASTAEELKAEVAKLAEKNFKYIILEMSKVNFMDSSGLGACMAAHKMLLEKKGRLACARPAEPVSKIFRITGADRKLAVAPSRSDAIKIIHDHIIAARTQK